jgi:hypothetical protein
MPADRANGEGPEGRAIVVRCKTVGGAGTCRGGSA